MRAFWLTLAVLFALAAAFVLLTAGPENGPFAYQLR